MYLFMYLLILLFIPLIGWHVVVDVMWGESVSQRIYMRLEDQAFSPRLFLHPDW